jgi:Family of unknown function (DUF5685)
MFGIIRPCRHRLGSELTAAWTAHLCGLCLALRDDHGQSARVATNYDGLLISVLVEAQSEAEPTRRTAGRCMLRGMRRADVAIGDQVRLAAAVSLALAAARVRDHVDDHDGVVGSRGVRPVARRVAERWVRAGADTGRSVGFDVDVLVDAMDRQGELERSAEPGSSLLLVTEPTETAVAAAFGHTAVLAGRPGNQAPLSEIGRLFGRAAHLLDAVEDYEVDLEHGKWNPLAATGTSVEEVRRMCVDAVLGIELALAEVEFTDGRLAHRLLTRELRRAVSRTFAPSGQPGCATPPPTGGYPPAPGGPGDPNYQGQWQELGYGQSPFDVPVPQAGGPPPSGGCCLSGCRDACCCDCCAEGGCECCADGCEACACD